MAIEGMNTVEDEAFLPEANYHIDFALREGMQLDTGFWWRLERTKTIELGEATYEVDIFCRPAFLVPPNVLNCRVGFAEVPPETETPPPDTVVPNPGAFLLMASALLVFFVATMSRRRDDWF